MIIEIKENGIIFITSNSKKAIPAGQGYFDLVDNKIVYYSNTQKFSFSYADVTSIKDKEGNEQLGNLADITQVYDYLISFFFLKEQDEQANADWNSTRGASLILNKPNLNIYANNVNLGNILFVSASAPIINDSQTRTQALGRIDRPFRTIQSAFNVALVNDIIFVFSGTYTGATQYAMPTTIIGIDKKTTFVTIESNGATTYKNVSVQGFSHPHGVSGSSFYDCDVLSTNVFAYYDNCNIAGTPNGIIENSNIIVNNVIIGDLSIKNCEITFNNGFKGLNSNWFKTFNAINSIIKGIDICSLNGGDNIGLTANLYKCNIKLNSLCLNSKISSIIKLEECNLELQNYSNPSNHTRVFLNVKQNNTAHTANEEFNVYKNNSYTINIF